MKTIYKYPLEWADEQAIAMPKGAKILSVQWIRGQVCIYALGERVGLMKNWEEVYDSWVNP